MKMWCAAALVCAVAATPIVAAADPFGDADESVTTQAFLRFPLGGDPGAPNERIILGLGSYTAAGACADAAGVAASDCRADQRLGLEYRFTGPRPGGYLVAPFGSAFLGDSSGDPGVSSGGGMTWVWIGLGAAALVAALSGGGDSSELCTGNTIPNPLTGECEPLVL